MGRLLGSETDREQPSLAASPLWLALRLLPHQHSSHWSEEISERERERERERVLRDGRNIDKLSLSLSPGTGGWA